MAQGSTLLCLVQPRQRATGCGMSETTTAPPPVQRLGPAVVLQGAALADVLHLVILGARARKARDGIDLSPDHVRLINLISAAVNDAPMSPTRRRHVALGADSEQ